MTTPEQNMAMCREFNERVFNEGDVSFAEKMMRDDFVDHSPCLLKPAWVDCQVVASHFALIEGTEVCNNQLNSQA